MNIIIIYLHTYIYISLPSSSQQFPVLLGRLLGFDFIGPQGRAVRHQMLRQRQARLEGQLPRQRGVPEKRLLPWNGHGMDRIWIYDIYIYISIYIYLSIYLYIYVCVWGYSAECVFLSYHIMNYISYIDQLVN